MRRWTWLAVAIVVSFLGATFTGGCDGCDGGDGGDGGDGCDGCAGEGASDTGAEECPPGCHFACLDGCAVAPIETAMLAPAATEARREPRAEAASSPLELNFPPELIPPRA